MKVFAEDWLDAKAKRHILRTGFSFSERHEERGKWEVIFVCLGFVLFF